ncbi:hypothetical protein CRYUN_Cryun24cG0062600 [Craigia yunnanensis]
MADVRFISSSMVQAANYRASGRLATTEYEDDTISFFIDCNNSGALFIHAAADGVTISDIIKPVYVPLIIHSFFPLNGLKNYEGIINPLLGIEITDLADGIFIGCTINHAVADGISFWHFFNSWSEISKGSIHLSKPPVFQRWFPDEKNIAKLNAKANAEIGTHNISSLQALLSHIWRSVIRNKNFDPNEETNYRVVVGARQRLQELPDKYFGNALLGETVSMKAKELLGQGIGNVVWQINKKIATINEETFKKFLKSWPVSPKLLTVGSMTNNAPFTSSSPRFNMYGNDFGWGKPIAIRSGSADKFDGKITLFCGEEK